MIKLIGTKDDFLEICDKIDLIKGVRLTQDRLYKLLVASIYHPGVFAFKSIENGKMNGCMVLLSSVDQLGEKVVSLVFVWIDAHYPKLHNKFIEQAVKIGKGVGATRLSIQTDKKEKVINRRLGKFGFKQACSIYEKVI